MATMSTWRELIDDALLDNDDKLVACTLSEDEMDAEFDAANGRTKGKPFTAWSETRVYFPVFYGGFEWVGSASRFPCDESCDHIGGDEFYNTIQRYMERKRKRY